MRYELHKTPEFEDWLTTQPLKARLQVEERLFTYYRRWSFWDMQALNGSCVGVEMGKWKTYLLRAHYRIQYFTTSRWK